MKTLSHEYPSSYASVNQARRHVSAFAAQCGLQPPDISDIALAVGEACNNAAEHGHVAHGHFSVHCSFNGHSFVVHVKDSGGGFELAGKGERMEPDQRGMRGLGIFIMRSLMDDISYAITDGGTSVRLTKIVSPNPATHEHSQELFEHDSSHHSALGCRG
ncbi:MAG: ATP-binding protein [Candidatus Eremiobacter antarcticus]|nr:ATP-binding protein [Candidatus Eremiobacteraeota bacterium]